jgi:NAD(P)H-dependent FMN reductase
MVKTSSWPNAFKPAPAASANGQNYWISQRSTFPCSRQEPKQPTGYQQAIAPLQELLATTPRWVICAPEYNGSIPPCLSNAIAWLSVQGDDFRGLFNGRPVAIATHSGGGGMEALISMRIQLAHLGAEVIGRQLLSNYAKPANDDSIDDLLQRLLQQQPLKL